MDTLAFMRLVSLIPSATDILFELGLGDRLVGVSHECELPQEMPALARLTAPRLDPGRPSAEIDRSVRELVETSLGVYEIYAERLRALEPDLILTQDQCEVCAVSLEALEAAVCDWLGGTPKLLSLAPTTMDEILNDIQRVAALTGVPERGVACALGAKRRIEAVRAQAEERSVTPRVAFLEWISPLMDGGLWIPEMIETAGGIPVFGSTGQHSASLSAKALTDADPDVVVVAPCGFDLERTAAELPALEAIPGFERIQAVLQGRLALCDGNRYFNRPGPGIVDSLEILGEILHPALFGRQREGSAWRRYECLAS